MQSVQGVNVRIQMNIYVTLLALNMYFEIDAVLLLVQFDEVSQFASHLSRLPAVQSVNCSTCLGAVGERVNCSQ